MTVQQAPSSSGSHSGGGGKGSSGKSSSGSSGTVTKDSQKGYRSEEQGVITGASNQAVNDGYSHWIKDARGWWLRYSDGTWPMGNTGAFHWEKVNGRWWAFGAEGYLSTGWIYDTLYQGWFYMDETRVCLQDGSSSMEMVLSEFESRRQCRHHVFKTPDTGRLVCERRRQLG